MSWGALFFFNSALLGVGLAMDAFSVSMANGMLEPGMRRVRAAKIAGVYAFFQFAMPMLGWLCVRTVVSVFAVLETAVPWIALILLVLIGGKMLWEGLRGEEEKEARRLTKRVLLLQGIATSLDAASVGFTISAYALPMALTASVIIAVVTFWICLGGLKIGRVIGTKWSSKASVLGGVILIAIGIEIFVTGVF